MRELVLYTMKVMRLDTAVVTLVVIRLSTVVAIPDHEIRAGKFYATLYH